MKAMLLFLAVLVLAAGCVTVWPSDALYFDLSADNAQAYNAKVQADANLPPDVRTWIGAEARKRAAEASWARGKAPLTSRPAN